MPYDELADMYARLAEVKPPESIKLTRVLPPRRHES